MRKKTIKALGYLFCVFISAKIATLIFKHYTLVSLSRQETVYVDGVTIGMSQRDVNQSREVHSAASSEVRFSENVVVEVTGNKLTQGENRTLIIEVGSTENAVRRILGPPDSILERGDSLPDVWYYKLKDIRLSLVIMKPTTFRRSRLIYISIGQPR